MSNVESRLDALEVRVSALEKGPIELPNDIYTDGACSGNPGPGGWAFVDLHTKTYVGGYDEKTTNNRMELMAVVRALATANRVNCKIISDSRYVVDCVNKKWYLAWQKNGWKTTKNTAVKNIDLWTVLIASIERLAPSFVWTRGHQKGERWNNFSDRLAGQCLAKRRQASGSIE
jgi:ribonuclease HI